MRNRLYPWAIFAILVIFIIFMGSQGKSLEAVNIWALILALVIIIIGLLFGMLRERKK
ncbi:MAG: hypothetical protein Q7R76_04305 [Candidatus Woesearchaeota archaeon]|nr:hypothetical protein [Candidatus Woesearchaeota archaeon]